MQSAKGSQEPTSDRQAILILGMHRSGTSALGGVVNALGAAAPKTPHPAQPHNPRGFYESVPLMQANDALLASAGSRWDDWRALNPQWVRSTAAKAHRQTIKDTLRDEFGDAPLFFIKDPRLCRFVPLYLSILREMGVNAVALLPVRNPLEVAYSLKRRDGFPLIKSLLLWLRHVLEAEYHSRQLPRCFLPHEKVLLDWRYHLDRAAARTGLIWPAHSQLTDAAIDRFLTLDLHHERATAQEMERHPDVAALVSETYAVLSTMADGEENNELTGRLDAVRTKFEEGCKTFGGAIAAAEVAAEDLRTELARRTAEADERLAAAREELVRQQQQTDDAHAALAERQRQADEGQAALVQRQQQLDDAHAALAHQQQQTQEAQAALAQQRRQLDEVEAALSQQQQQNREAQAALAQQRQQLEEVGAALAQQQQQSREAEAALAQQQAQLNEAEAALAQHRRQSRDSQMALAQQRSMLADHEAEIRRLRDTIRGAAGEAESLRATVARQQAEMHQHAEERNAARADSSTMLASRSWRWTAPLRRLRQLVR